MVDGRRGCRLKVASCRLRLKTGCFGVTSGSLVVRRDSLVGVCRAR